jgi:hypothetical protein
MNAYLALLTPLIPAAEQAIWKEDLIRLSRIMIDQFYSPTDKLFFLSANRPSDKALATAGTDFGHTAKAFWMIRRAGLVTGQNDLVSFAEENARILLSRAYLEDCGCWAGGYQRGGGLDKIKFWWVYAELDQLAGTLALTDRTYAQYLPKTYDYWFSRFVDKAYGEVWNGVDGDTHAPIRNAPKQWEWKNAYHTFEHALIGYIVAQQLHGEPVVLHFAFSTEKLPENTQPYFFTGRVTNVQISTAGSGKQVQKVSFAGVR